MSTTVLAPDIGDFKEVEVVDLLVGLGDYIEIDQSIIMVESEKASIEIPSSHKGVESNLLVKVGDKISEGSSLLVLNSAEKTSLLPVSGRGLAVKASLREPVSNASSSNGTLALFSENAAPITSDLESAVEASGGEIPNETGKIKELSVALNTLQAGAQVPPQRLLFAVDMAAGTNGAIADPQPSVATNRDRMVPHVQQIIHTVHDTYYIFRGQSRLLMSL